MSATRDRWGPMAPRRRRTTHGAVGQVPHRRYNPLTGEWVLVSPQRGNRPWRGAVEPPSESVAAAHDADCYLCAGNKRVNGAVNPSYSGPFVFSNDFPALLSGTGGTTLSRGGSALLKQEPVEGEARVICYSERHDLPMSRLSLKGISAIVDCWIKQYQDLARRYDWVAIFENKGAAMGCSNPHPHGQIWASSAVPSEVEREDQNQRAYFEQNGTVLLQDYAAEELADGQRTVFCTEHWFCVVPHWASWPFETLLLPVQPAARLTDLSKVQRTGLASALRRLTIRYDNLFQTEFPYSMGWHGAPPRMDDCAHWQLHAHFYPPLLRSASIRKFMVGYELLAEAQRDLTPENAAAHLRASGEEHYLEKNRRS